MDTAMPKARKNTLRFKKYSSLHKPLSVKLPVGMATNDEILLALGITSDKIWLNYGARQR
jgi:hypothetical protein